MELISSLFWKAVEFISKIALDSNGFNADVEGAIGSIMSMGMQLDFVINWSILFACFSATLAFEAGMFVFKLVMWLAKLARG